MKRQQELARCPRCRFLERGSAKKTLSSIMKREREEAWSTGGKRRDRIVDRPTDRRIINRQSRGGSVGIWRGSVEGGGGVRSYCAAGRGKRMSAGAAEDERGGSSSTSVNALSRWEVGRRGLFRERIGRSGPHSQQGLTRSSAHSRHPSTDAHQPTPELACDNPAAAPPATQSVYHCF